MKALYRKYRPTKLSEVIGQEQVTKSLEASLKKGHISHAYLFTGPRGCGKTSVARIFAHEINGFKYELEDFYPDILEIDAASNTGVDNIRELRERAAVAPAEGKYKIYIIDEVHMLSKSAFNALLKTLEEPPKHVVFIMATTDAYKVLPTIISRSQVYEFKLADPNTMQKHLKKIAEKEGIKIAEDALELIVRRGGGSFRDSISLLDQISTLKEGEISADDIIKSLGLPSQAKIDSLLEAYLSSDLAEISARLKDLLNSGVRAEIVAEELISHIVEAPRAELLPLLKSLSEINSSFPEAKLLLAFTSNVANRISGLQKQAGDPRRAVEGWSENGVPPEEAFSEGKSSLGVNFRDRTPKHPCGTSQPAESIESSWPTESTESNQPTESIESNRPASGDILTVFLTAVKEASPSLGDIITNNASQKLNGNTINIIPNKSVYENILRSKNNSALLEKCLPENCNLEILSEKESVIYTNDPQINKISAIMGGKVMEVKAKNGGNIPF